MNTILDDTYMRRHLEGYILFQIEQGYAAKDIRAALVRFGYKKDLVKGMFKELHVPLSGKKKARKYSAADLDQELKIYVQSLLIDYIVKEHKVGYDLDAIKKALVNYGHDPRLVDEAVAIIGKGLVVDYRASSSPVKFSQKVIASLTVFLIFASLVFLSISTDTSIFTILPNFLPLFVAFILINIAFAIIGNTKLLAALPLFAVLLAVGAFIGGINMGVLGDAPGSDTLLLLNAIGTFISTGIVCFLSRKDKRPAVVADRKKKKSKKHKAEEKFIEDKIHVPKLGEVAPEEPVQVRQAQRGRKSTHNTENSMLSYLRQEIDKPKRRHHPSNTASVHYLPEKKERKKRLKLKKVD
jgi:hypothetical protein